MSSLAEFQRLLGAVAVKSAGSMRDSVMQLGPRILTETDLFVFGKKCELAEVELYYFDDRHQDIYAHCHPIQASFGKWYLHRMGSGFKNGTYKGLDFTFGNGESFGGVLIRSLRSEDGQLISGPSLCVDYILSMGKIDSVQELDRCIDRSVWDVRNPVRLETCRRKDFEVYCSPRIGLTLGKLPVDPRKREFILRPYRSVCFPRANKKGRVHLFLSLHLLGYDTEHISQITGTPVRKLRQYADYVADGANCDIDSLTGTLGSKELCLLAGALMNSGR